MDIVTGAAGEFYNRVSPIVKLNDVDRCIGLVDSKYIFQRNSKHMCQEGPNHSTMTKNGDTIFGVLRHNFFEFWDRARPQLRKRFPTLDVKSLNIFKSLVKLIWVPAVDLVDAQSFPGTEGEFAQFRAGGWGELVVVSNILGAEQGSFEVATVNRSNWKVLQGVGETTALVLSLFGEVYVEVAIKTDLTGVGGFPVSDKVNAAGGFAVHGLFIS